MKQSFMFLAPSNYFIAQCAEDIQSGTQGWKSPREILPASFGMTNSGRGPRLVMIVVRFCGRFNGAAVQEIIFFLLFVAILRTFWVVLFHFEFLLGGQRGQMTNEANEFP